jgi:hypothetical protein
MVEWLINRWKVSKKDLLLILLVFAITGFSTAYVSKAATGWVGFTDATHWSWKLLLRLAILIFGYQAILLTVAFLLGQFPFFWQYEKKLLMRLRRVKDKKTSDTKQKRKEIV